MRMLPYSIERSLNIDMFKLSNDFLKNLRESTMQNFSFLDIFSVELHWHYKEVFHEIFTNLNQCLKYARMLLYSKETNNKIQVLLNSFKQFTLSNKIQKHQRCIRTYDSHIKNFQRSLLMVFAFSDVICHKSRC